MSAGAVEPTHWVHDLEQGGGRILGEVCHFVDSRVPGEQPDRNGLRVWVRLSRCADAGVRQRRRHANHENGTVGTITYAADGHPQMPKERVEVFCGDRAAVVDDYRSLELYGPSGRKVGGTRTTDKGHGAEIAAFVEGVSNGRQPVALEEIANVTAATLAIVESIRTARPVRLS